MKNAFARKNALAKPRNQSEIHLHILSAFRPVVCIQHIKKVLQVAKPLYVLDAIKGNMQYLIWGGGVIVP